MPTTSTVPAVKAALVGLIDAAVDVEVFYAWPGPKTPNECVFVGRYPEQVGDNRVDVASEIATVKAGRKHRTETYTVPVTIWSFRPDLTSDEAQAAEQRAFELFEAIEDVLADDPTLGLDIQWARLGDCSVEPHPFEKGWVIEVIPQIEVQARLT